MIKIVASVEFFGDEFSPAKAQTVTGLELHNRHEKGDIGTSGKYKDKPVPYGSASLIAPSGVFHADRILWLVDRLRGKIELIRECGAEDINFMVAYFHEGQCNGELTVKELQGIASLGIPFCFSTYEVEDVNAVV